MKILETERLYLREFEMLDAHLLLELDSDPEVTKYVGGTTLKNINDAKELLEKTILPQYKNRLGRWAVHLKENDQFIGWCGIKYLSGLNEYDLGYRFLQKYWGKGYATESSQKVMDYAIIILKLKEIAGRASIENYRSIKVLEKAGLKFLEEGIEHGDKIKKYKLIILENASAV